MVFLQTHLILNFFPQQETKLLRQLGQPEDPHAAAEELQDPGVHQPVVVQGSPAWHEETVQQLGVDPAALPRHPQRQIHQRRRRQRRLGQNLIPNPNCQS